MTMKEPLSLRISDESNRKRAADFQRVLDRRAANPSEVLRRLIDAYIQSDGAVTFPARLVSQNGDRAI